MKPFSPWYFIRANKLRCALLIFLIFLSWIAYLGGLYVTNVADNWRLPLEYLDKFVPIGTDGTEESNAELEAILDAAARDERIATLRMGQSNGLYWTAILGFETGQYGITFATVEDFKTYCAYLDISCDFDALTQGSMVMSEKFAKNIGLKLGDTVDSEDYSKIYGTYTLDTLTAEDSYPAYFIDERLANQGQYMLFGDGMDWEALVDFIHEAAPGYRFMDLAARIESQLMPIYMLYLVVVFFLAVILAVTINAAFVGMYQRRNFEFAIYRALGISRRRRVGKIVGELLCMDAIAIVLGGGISFLFLYLLNNLALYPVGQYLRYYHPMALLGLVICNFLVVVPLILSRCKTLLKANVCEY